MTAHPPMIPAWQLYGEQSPFPDLLHIEAIRDRAAGHDWQIVPHRHLHLHQVFCILSGTLTLTLEGQRLTPQPPLVMNIPRGVVHGFGFSAETEGWVLTLPAADFPELLGAEAHPRPMLDAAFVAPVPAGLPDAFAALADLHTGGGALRRLKLRAAVLALCCAVAEAAPPSPRTPGTQDPRILRFQTLIRAHLTDGWTLSTYAAALALSDRHLRRLCLQATGLSAHQLIENTRLHEACQLLAYTRMRVQEVGFALGFDDPAYFARAFRRGMGMTPGQYRARLEA